jgi:hypothetical protein
VTGWQWTAAKRALIGRPPKNFLGRRGSVLFHDSCVFHLSAPNGMRRGGRAFVVRAADGAMRSSSLPLSELDLVGIEVGSALTGPHTPVAWPRVDARLSGPPR